MLVTVMLSGGCGGCIMLASWEPPVGCVVRTESKQSRVRKTMPSSYHCLQQQH